MGGDLHCHTKLSDSSMGIDDLIVLAQKIKNKIKYGASMYD